MVMYGWSSGRGIEGKAIEMTYEITESSVCFLDLRAFDSHLSWKGRTMLYCLKGLLSFLSLAVDTRGQGIS